MPLMDHFSGSLKRLFPFRSLHQAWAVRITEELNMRWLPSGFSALEGTTSTTRSEIDIATYEMPTISDHGPQANGSNVSQFVVPAPLATVALRDRQAFETEIQVADEEGTLVAVIELISPSNKGRPAEREGFVAKMASHILGGVSVLLVDIASSKQFNLHNELVALLESDEGRLDPNAFIYASSYRPKSVDEATRADIWAVPLAIGRELPTMPLRITGDTFVPIELELTYSQVCSRRRLG